MGNNSKIVFLLSVLILFNHTCESAKINTPRVLLPWFENFVVNFTFEIIEGGCYTWSLSRDDIIDLEPLYEDSWGHCSRAARVSVSKSCIPPGSVIILAEEVNSGEILRGDVDVNKIMSLKVMSTTWKLYLEEAPEAFEVVAYDDSGNTFSTLEGIVFTWSAENVDKSIKDAIVTLVRWKDTDYEAPHGVAELENLGQKSYSVLLYGQAMGEAKVTVCLDQICADINLHVVASVVLTPAMSIIALGDTLRYKVVRARAGRLTVQDVIDTVYYMQITDGSDIAILEDSVSLVRGAYIGTTSVSLLSGPTEVATATLTVVEPHSIKVSLRPSSLVVRGEPFNIHCVVLDIEGRALTAGDQIVITLSVDGEAFVDIVQSNLNGTLTEAVAQSIGNIHVTAKLASVAGKKPSRKVEGYTSGISVEPLEVIPPVMYISYTDTNVQDIQLKHRGGGNEPVVWSEVDSDIDSRQFSLSSAGVLKVRGMGELNVIVQLKKYPHIKATGRIISSSPEYLQLTSTGQARVNHPHHIHVSLTGIDPATGEFFIFHGCNCASFSTAMLEGPELQSISSVNQVEPIEGACCVLEAIWLSRGVAVLRVRTDRAEDTSQIRVRSAPQLVWPQNAAALVGATLPVLGLGEALFPQSQDARIADIILRDGPPPHKYADLQLFTLKCNKKGDVSLRLTSQAGDENEYAQFEVACASHVSRIRLEPPETPGNCSGPTKLWLRPGHEVKLKVTLLDAIGRELLDERGPKVKWEVNPGHKGIEFRAVDRLMIETHPEYIPVPVPHRYYQIVMSEEKAVGWAGTITASIPEATANIHARVVAPLQCDSLQVNVAWESETVSKVIHVSGGSGKYAVESPKGVTAKIEEDGYLSIVVPGSGVYDFVVTDLCISAERQYIEIHIEEVINVEASTSRAVCVGSCVPISALVTGPSRKYLVTSSKPDWKVAGSIEVKGDKLCGLKEGVGRVRAAYSGVWSNELEVLVFPPLAIVPSRVRLPIGGKLQLRHSGGPPTHLATLHYETVDGVHNADVSPTGVVVGTSLGSSRVKLVARDVAGLEMASAQADIEIVPISGLKVHAATQTLLVGNPCPLWLECEGLGPSVLAGLQPTPRVTWAVRDPTVARLVTTHNDDHLEKSNAEGLSVRVIPLKAGLITIDVKVRKLGKISESRTWESTLEILAINDIHTGIEGAPNDFVLGDRLAIAVGSLVRLKSIPRGNWRALNEDGVFELSSGGELKGLKPGHGVVVAMHRDERNHVYRETTIHVEVSIPYYCTAEASGQLEETAVRVVMRNNVGRELIAPDVTLTAYPPLAMHLRRNAHSSLGSELVFSGLDSVGTFMTFHGTAGGVTLKDEVWVTGSDSNTDRIIASGGWVVCVDGTGWRSPPGVSMVEGTGVSLVTLTTDVGAKHTLKMERPLRSFTILQLPINKFDFQPGEWPSSLVPLSIESSGLKNGPVLCTEEQKLSLIGVHVDLPFTCRTEAPHTAQATLDLDNGQIGCSILPSSEVTEATEVELCAEWGVSRICTRTLLLPLIYIKPTKVSLVSQPSSFTIYGHPHALKLVKITTSPGLKMELNSKMEGEITVSLSSDADTCGYGWVNVISRMTSQDLRVEVERECDQTCGTLLAAIFAFLRPYLSTLITVGAVVSATIYVYGKLSQKSGIRLPQEPTQSIFRPNDMTNLNRSRTWSRSPYANNGPVTPIYGDTSLLQDSHYLSNSSHNHSQF